MHVGAVEQGDEADEPLGGTRPEWHAWRGRRRRLVPAQAWNRGHRLAAYRRCSADAGLRRREVERMRAAAGVVSVVSVSLVAGCAAHGGRMRR